MLTHCQFSVVAYITVNCKHSSNIRILKIHNGTENTRYTCTNLTDQIFQEISRNAAPP